MMSIYTNKSDLFMSAAEDINNDTNKCYFLVVPHSAYYSCLLLMKHLCYKKFGINNENEMKNDVDSTLHGSHEIMIGYVRKRMTQSCTSIMDKKKVVEFANKIGQLKKLRTKADYEEVTITSTQSSQAIELAKDVRNILKHFRYGSV